MLPLPPRSPLFPYTTLFRSGHPADVRGAPVDVVLVDVEDPLVGGRDACEVAARGVDDAFRRSEEHTSELQSPMYLVCRLLLEKKKIINNECNVCDIYDYTYQ